MCLCDEGILGTCEYLLSREWPSCRLPTTELPDPMKAISFYSFSFLTGKEKKKKNLFAFRMKLGQEAGTLLSSACLIS